MESGIQLKESGIHLKIGIQNLTDKHWNRVLGIWNTTLGIQNPTDKHWNRVPGLIRSAAQGIRNPTKDWNPESY